MICLTDFDVAGVLRRTPAPLFEQLKVHPKLFMAGGFLRACVANEDAADIDLFAPSKDYAKACAEWMAGECKVSLLTTDNAFTVLRRPAPIQYIHRWTFDKPIDALDSFDFTIAQAAIWWANDAWQSACSENFYADLAARRLVYLSPKRNEDAGGSLIRVLKFYQRGYRIPLDSLGAVIARLVGGIRNDMDGKHEAFMSNEEYRTKLLTGLLFEVDPNANPKRYIIPQPEQT